MTSASHCPRHSLYSSTHALRGAAQSRGRGTTQSMHGRGAVQPARCGAARSTHSQGGSHGRHPARRDAASVQLADDDPPEELLTAGDREDQGEDTEVMPFSEDQLLSIIRAGLREATIRQSSSASSVS